MGLCLSEESSEFPVCGGFCGVLWTLLAERDPNAGYSALGSTHSLDLPGLREMLVISIPKMRFIHHPPPIRVAETNR